METIFGASVQLFASEKNYLEGWAWKGQLFEKDSPVGEKLCKNIVREINNCSTWSLQII